MKNECVIATALGWLDYSKWFQELKKALILYQYVRIPYYKWNIDIIREYDKTISKNELITCLKPSETTLQEFDFAVNQAFFDLQDKELYNICNKFIKSEIKQVWRKIWFELFKLECTELTHETPEERV